MAGLQGSEFQAKTSQTVGPFKPGLKNGWYMLNLTATSGSINLLTARGRMTQIHLRFQLEDNNNLANYLSLYSDNAAPASRPQLIIE